MCTVLLSLNRCTPYPLNKSMFQKKSNSRWFKYIFKAFQDGNACLLYIFIFKKRTLFDEMTCEFRQSIFWHLCSRVVFVCEYMKINTHIYIYIQYIWHITIILSVPSFLSPCTLPRAVLDSGGTCSSLDGSDCDGTRSKPVEAATVGCGGTLLWARPLLQILKIYIAPAT